MSGEVGVAAAEAEARRPRSADHPRTLDPRRQVPRAWGG